MNAGLVSTAMMETDTAAGDDGSWTAMVAGYHGGGGDRKNARDARFSGSLTLPHKNGARPQQGTPKHEAAVRDAKRRVRR